MVINQLSIFMENRYGRLEEVLKILAENEINIVALSLAEAADYGMLRLIVSDPIKGKEVLNNDGISAMLTEVLGLRFEHKSGSLYDAMKILVDNGINIEYMYAFANADDASAIIKIKDINDAIDIIQKNDLKLWKAEDAYKIK